MKHLSIGMFDSGIGGLTVLKEVKKQLPHEHIIYLGDMARLPYGNKSPYTVIRYSLENALFLLAKGIKMLIVACNTSSALSLSILSRKLPVPVIGVIGPAAGEAVKLTHAGKIGVIGTRATVRSEAYPRAIQRLNPHIEVVSRPCPLFVPIVEEGLESDEVAYLAARKYLGEFDGSGIDVMIMGCTHYPIMEPVIRQVLGEGVRIVNAGRETAKQAIKVLEERGAVRKTGKGGVNYYVTDSPESCREIGSRFLGEPVEHVKFVKNLNLTDFRLSA